MRNPQVHSDADDLNDHFIFDSISVHFRGGVFLRQLFIHTFLPFSMVFSPNMTAQSFYSLSPATILFHLLTLTVWGMCLCYVMMRYTAPQFEASLYEGCIWFPLLFYFLHRITIAVKYGSMTDTEYQRFMSNTNDKITDIYNGQLLMLRSWGRAQNQQVSDFEIVSSALRTGAHLERLYFVLPNPSDSDESLSQMLQWTAFLLDVESVDKNDTCADMITQPDGTIVISLFAICKRLQIHSYDEVTTVLSPWSHVSHIFAIVLALIPFISIMGQSGSLKLEIESRWTMGFLMTSAIITFIFVEIVFQFIFTATYDCQRIHVAQEALHAVIRLSDLYTTTTLDFIPFHRKNVRLSHHLTKQTAAVSHLLSSVKEAPLQIQLSRKYSTQKGLNNSNNNNFSVMEMTEFPLLEEGGEHKNNKDVDQGIESVSMCKQKFTSKFRQFSILDQRLVNYNEEVTTFPRLSLQFEPNIMAWSWARLIMQNIGIRFRARLEIFTIFCCASMAILIAIVLAMVLKHPPGPARAAAFYSPLFQEAFVSATIFGGFLIVYTYLAAGVNYELNQQRATIAVKLLRAREHIVELRVTRKSMDEGLIQCPVIVQDMDKKLAHYESVEKALSICLDSIIANNDHRPYLVFGIRADYSLTMSICSTMVSFYITLLSAK